MLQLRHYIFVYMCLSMGYQILSVPIEYDISESERELSYDFDTEQSQARYDPRLLSEELKDSRSTSQEGAAACYTAELKYEHGEKVTRNDPCEVCLCVDGEIFCWWKKCDNAKRKKEVRKSRQQKSSHHSRRKPTHKNQSKFKAMKYIPKNVLNFPQHLPAIRQYDFNQNETKSIFHPESEESYLPKMSGRKKPLKMDTKPTLRPPPQPLLADIPYRDDSMTILKGRHEDMNKEMPYSDKQRSNRQQQQQQQQQQQRQFKQQQQHREKVLEQQHRQQGGLYEKAIINDDGVFVEKVNKINDISEESKGSNSNNNNNNNNNNNSSNKESIQPNDVGRDGNSNGVQNGNGPLENSNGGAKPLDFSQNEKIQFVDVPLAKHYIITSSGSVENTDILASDNVLSQFRNGYSVVVESPSRTDGNSTARPDALARSPQLGVGDSNAASASIVTPSAAQVAATTVTANIADVTAIIAPSSSLLSSSYSSQPVQSSGSSLSSLSADASSSSSSPSSSDSSSAQHRNNGAGSSSSSSSFGGDTTVEPPPQEQQCVVMGTSYKIGTILPQDTGNCLQCICIEGASEGDSPRVTCSPHNCPPLVLPDLFDTTGY